MIKLILAMLSSGLIIGFYGFLKIKKKDDESLSNLYKANNNLRKFIIDKRDYITESDYYIIKQTINLIHKEIQKNKFRN